MRTMIMKNHLSQSFGRKSIMNHSILCITCSEHKKCQVALSLEFWDRKSSRTPRRQRIKDSLKRSHHCRPPTQSPLCSQSDWGRYRVLSTGTWRIRVWTLEPTQTSPESRQNFCCHRHVELKVLGSHELDKYSRNAAFVNKPRIFCGFETIVVYSTGATHPWSTNHYILGMCPLHLWVSCWLSDFLPIVRCLHRGIHRTWEGLWVPIGVTYEPTKLASLTNPQWRSAISWSHMHIRKRKIR